MAIPVITISREYGSGGRLIGRLLAEDLGIPFYDRELITRAAADSGLSPEVLAAAENQPPASLLYSLSAGMGYTGLIGGGIELPLADQLFLAQFDTIRKVAEEGPCVIVGRCADYVLRDTPECVHFFIHADMPTRIDRVTKEYGEPEKDAEARILKADKRRASYYNHYTTEKWGAAKTYDCSVDSGKLGIGNTVRLLRAYLDLRG